MAAAWLLSAHPAPALDRQESLDWLDLPRLRAELLARVNVERRAAGAPPLQADVRLDCAAQEHAETLASYGIYTHTAPGGPNLGARARSSGYAWAALAENLMERETTAEAVMNAWLHSPPHRRNLLDPRYTEMGVGIALVREQQGYRVVWVQDFGSR